MKFLVDAQLPIALAKHLQAKGHAALHVADVSLVAANDEAIWRRAIGQGEIIVTKDEDFAVRRSVSAGGPQIIWIRLGNCSNPILIRQLDRVWPVVEQRLLKGDALVEIL